ncbi:partial Calcium-transporting ATPase, partial [Anaerolineae bacterium]
MPQARQESLSTQLAHTLTPAQTTWHAEHVEHLFTKFGTSEKGLTTEQAKQTAAKHGWNELPRAEKKSPVMIFLKQFASLLILILVLAAGISAAMGETVEAVAIVVIVILAGVVGFIQEYKAEQALEALKQLAAPLANVFRDGREVTVAS